jgi:hypothetical protein
VSAPQPLPLLDLRGLNEDWQVGDLAECVLDDWVSDHPLNPKKGEVLTVSFVDHYGEQVLEGMRLLFSVLGFVEKPSLQAWHSQSFKKHRGVAEAITRAAARAAPVRTPAREGVDA